MASRVIERFDRYHRRRRWFYAAWLAASADVLFWLSGFAGTVIVKVRDHFEPWYGWYPKDWANYPIDAGNFIGSPSVTGSIVNTFANLVFLAALLLTAGVVSRHVSLPGSRSIRQPGFGTCVSLSIPYGFSVIGLAIVVLFALERDYSPGYLSFNVRLNSSTLMGVVLLLSLCIYASKCWRQGIAFRFHIGLIERTLIVPGGIAAATMTLSLIVWMVIKLTGPPTFSPQVERLLTWMFNLNMAWTGYDRHFPPVLAFVLLTALYWSLTALVIVIRDWPRIRAEAVSGECPACGYDLRGTVAAGRTSCPECGAAIPAS